VIYRPAFSVDVPAMAASRNGDPANGPADERMAAYLEGRHHPQQALAPRVAFVAMDEDRVAGYIAGHLTRRYDCDGEVQYLYVGPSYRRRGIATALLRMLACWFLEERALTVCVNVNLESPSAQPFYEARGAATLNKYWMVWSDVSRLCGKG
jgi:GNAT superfamily N-acetyltransferase